jgi:hypothetical protein
MDHEDDSAFIDYYEVLNVAEDAATAEIAAALERYQASMTPQLNSYRTMQSARYAINYIIPQIRSWLLSGEARRGAYDVKLAESRKEKAEDEHDALPDHAGLDQRIEQPFFFDQYNGFDTEPITNTLRGIARRLDEDWPRARIWITDRARIHPIVGYLTHAALRPRLAERVGQIIQAVRQEEQPRMDINEGIERCIAIFNPAIQRPYVRIEHPHFDGKVLDAGSFLPDRPAQATFTLYHNGLRGCAFGSIESRTKWITFPGGATTLRFALMPEGTAPEIGPTHIQVPLIFHVDQLQHNTEYTAELLVRMENQERPAEKILPVVIHISALPPRVWFEPRSAIDAPIRLAPKRRGEPVSAVIMPRNAGDEQLIPLVGRIFTGDNAASASPEKFRTNQPVTLTIDTTGRPYGSVYDVVYKIDYRQVPGAAGPEAIYVQGVLLPTIWQSMLRTKSFGSRALAGSILGVIGFLFLGGLNDYLTLNFPSAWYVLLLIPFLLLGLTYVGMQPVITHARQAGRLQGEKVKVSPSLSWGLPLGVGLFLALVCGLIHNTALAFALGGSIGALVGAVSGFVLDAGTTEKIEGQ